MGEISKRNTAEALSYLKKISENGHLKKHLISAVEWQKQVRKERALPFRK